MVKQFEVYWVALNPTVGSEIYKKRPCVVISPKVMNVNLNTVIIAPITSTIKQYPTRVNVVFNNRKGQIILDQIRSVDKRRLKNKEMVLNKATSKKIKIVLKDMFK